MFIVQLISSPKDQKHFLKEFEPTQSSWIVSDLKSKLDIHRSLLRERDFVAGDSVLRASELWKQILTRVRPDLLTVSREFALTLIAQKLATMDLALLLDDSPDWTTTPGAAQTVYDYMSQLMPILAHASGDEMIGEWFVENEASQVRWGRWYELSRRLWNEFLSDGFIAPPWIPGVLVNEIDLESAWQKPLIIDLGAELTQVEADLLIQLSRTVDITILKPDPSWSNEYQRTLSAYSIFDQKLEVETRAAPEILESKRPTPNHQYLKFTTMIAEVKDATARVRQWLDQGIRPTAIAIVAPDIELYWPSLSSYLEVEGILMQKDHVRRLHTFPDISRWLAHLRLKTGSFAEADVELGLFDSNGAGRRLISFERFRVLFTTIYGREDLERVKEVAARFLEDLDLSSLLGRDDFTAWALRHLPEDVLESHVEPVFSRIFAECPQSLMMDARRWLEYLEQICARVECRVKGGSSNGIAVINLSSAENSSVTKMILMGLTDNSLRKTAGTAILASDISSLALQLGFQLSSEDQAKLEFEARWVAEDRARELLLMVPETDFAGGVQAASWFWIKGARSLGSLGHVTLPQLTRWDEMQRGTILELAVLKKWNDEQSQALDLAMREDLGERSLAEFGAHRVSRVSASSIEDYLRCPFIFAAKNLFRLVDQPELDLDVDPSRRGSLMHKLLELLTRESVGLDVTDLELEAILERARVESRVEFADPRMWPPLRARFKDLARRFLAFESENHEAFPESETVGFETGVEGYLNPVTGEFRKTKAEGDLLFKGRIDRVDRDRAGHLMLIDYKSSKSSVKQHGSWLKHNKIQLILYAMAVEAGLSEIEANSVLAGIYYIMRPLNRDHGFKVEDVEQGLFGVDKKKNRLSSIERENLFAGTRELVKKAVSEMLRGNFAPNPHDRKTCGDCQWSALCRAPHLNT